MGGMIPWLILSHVGDDVIKRKLRNKRKRRKMESHTFGLWKGGGNFLLLIHTVNAHPKEKRKCKEKEEKQREKGRKMRRRNDGKMK